MKTEKNASTKNMITNASNTTEVTTTEANGNETAVGGFAAFETPIEKIREILAANLGHTTVSAGDLERIKIPAGGVTAWAVPDTAGDQMVKELSGVILMWHEVRNYWKLSMEQSDGNMPPDCSSTDATTGIGLPGGNCQSCPFAQFGSDPKGEGQACKLSRQLLLLREENLLPVIVSLPASSIKAARLYFTRLADKRLPIYGLITKIGLEKVPNAQGIVYSRATFTSGEHLQPEQVLRAKAYATILGSLLEAAPVRIANPSQEAEGEII